jgi:hypothetical protein
MPYSASDSWENSAARAITVGLSYSIGGPLAAITGTFLGGILGASAGELVRIATEKLSESAGEGLFGEALERLGKRLRHRRGDVEAVHRKALRLSLAEIGKQAPPYYEAWFTNWDECLKSKEAIQLEKLSPGKLPTATELECLFRHALERLDAQGASMRGLTLNRRADSDLLKLVRDGLSERLERDFRNLTLNPEYEEVWKLCVQEQLSAIHDFLTGEHGPALDAPFAAVRSTVDFTYRARATDFVGRPNEISALLSFMGDPRVGLWTVISGPAGSGKNRLAAELIALVESPESPVGAWRAGFLRHSNHWLQNHSLYWNRSQDTLLIIDYAGELDRFRLGDFLAHLNEPGIVAGSHVRVLLLDRLPPDSDLGVASRVMNGSDIRADIAANRWQVGSRDPLALQPVQLVPAIEIVQARAGAAWCHEAEKRVRDAIGNDPELARPLFALMMGDAIASVDLSNGMILNPVTVTTHALSRLFTHPHSEERSLDQARMIWATATACQGASEDNLFHQSTYANLTMEQWSAKSLKVRQCVRRLSRSSSHQFAGDGSEDRVPPLQPDFMGELFVMRELLFLPQDSMIQFANTMMSVAWTIGDDPDVFLYRITSDFVGRALQVSNAFNCSQQRFGHLLLTLIVSGLYPKSLERGGQHCVAHCAYLAARAGEVEAAVKLLQTLEVAYSREPDRIAFALASGWYGTAIASDLPSDSERYLHEAIEAIVHLAETHDTQEMALLHAKSLRTAILKLKGDERDQAVEELWNRKTNHLTPEIARYLAEGLFYSTLHEKNLERLQSIVNRIRLIRDKFNIPEVSLAWAKALYNLSWVENMASKRRELADLIGEIRSTHNTVEIAEIEAKALRLAALAEKGPEERLELASRIEDLWCAHDSKSLAATLSVALLQVTYVSHDAAECLKMAERIGDIRKRFNTEEIAENQALAYRNASSLPDQGTRKKIAAEIGSIRAQFDRPYIATQEAHAIYNFSVTVKDAAMIDELAKRITALLKVHDTGDIAELAAKAMLNAVIASPVE